MVEVEWSAQASRDLESIVEFVSKDSPQYARLFVVDIFRTLDRIAMFPNSGRIVPESFASSWVLRRDSSSDCMPRPARLSRSVMRTVKRSERRIV